MAGLQELAAVVGIAEVGCRSISMLYAFLKDLREVPREVENIRIETSTLDQILSTLSRLASTNNDVLSFMDRVGLVQAVNRCGVACDRLRGCLPDPGQYESRRWLSRIQFRMHKKTLDATAAEISVAKQTAILSIVVTQL